MYVMQRDRSDFARNRYVLLVWMFSVLYWIVLGHLPYHILAIC